MTRSKYGKPKACSKRNPCPICGAKDGCKVMPDKTVICRRCNTKQETPSGYFFMGPAAKDKNWGLYKPESEKTIFDKPILLLSLEDYPSETLSLVERSIQYKKIINVLDLHPFHCLWLKRRGYPIHLIEYLYLIGVRTYNHGLDSIPTGLSPLLPGLDLSGIIPFLYQEGLLLPMLNWDGLILGFQVVPRQRTIKENNDEKYSGAKYEWLSTEGKVSLPKPYDSLPHGFFEPPDNKDPELLLLTEGALKGAVIAYLSGYYVLSTANGAHFNYDQLAATIRAKGIKKVCICPDAGMMRNCNIIKAYFEVIAMVKQLGIEPEIVWWGQLEKEDLDLDELILEGLNDAS